MATHSGHWRRNLWWSRPYQVAYLDISASLHSKYNMFICHSDSTKQCLHHSIVTQYSFLAQRFRHTIDIRNSISRQKFSWFLEYSYQRSPNYPTLFCTNLRASVWTLNIPRTTLAMVVRITCVLAVTNFLQPWAKSQTNTACDTNAPMCRALSRFRDVFVHARSLWILADIDHSAPQSNAHFRLILGHRPRIALGLEELLATSMLLYLRIG